MRRHSSDLELSRAYDNLLETYMPSSVLLNRSRQVLHVFGESDKYVKMPKGRASLDILSMLDGDLRLGMS
ncbi:MAG: hypothetical protein MK080_13460, partial [Opitutales bacterium]|nr:hypothetical protein [Opitutales bacterium]